MFIKERNEDKKGEKEKKDEEKGKEKREKRKERVKVRTRGGISDGSQQILDSLKNILLTINNLYLRERVKERGRKKGERKEKEKKENEYIVYFDWGFFFGKWICPMFCATVPHLKK